MNLNYKKDENGKEILTDEEGRHQIMMEWEKPYMEKSIEFLNPFGRVLEIGFGMGFSASKICSFESVLEYNVIECSPIVWERFEEFKKHYLILRPELKINLIKGRWEDVLKISGFFDCIYFDDYVLDDTPNYIYKSLTRFNKFLYEILKNNSNIGSKISFYSTTGGIDFYKKINCIEAKIIEFPISIPENCNYAKGDKMFIPLITKISIPDPDLKEKLFSLMNQPNKFNEINDQMKKEMENQAKYKKLFEDIKTRPPSCELIVIDNFYNNPYEVRNYILTQDFSVRGNFPGQRTISYASENLKDIIQKYIEPFGGKIVDFKIPKEDGSDSSLIYNGSFQYTTSRDRSWVHMDEFNNWAGILYLTPNAPLTAGTSFYKFYDGSSCKKDMKILDNKFETDRFSQDMTKWKKVDDIGNVFNRLIIFNSFRYHMSMDYFGDSKENGRLFQVFFFSTERL